MIKQGNLKDTATLWNNYHGVASAFSQIRIEVCLQLHLIVQIWSLLKKTKMVTAVMPKSRFQNHIQQDNVWRHILAHYLLYTLCTKRVLFSLFQKNIFHLTKEVKLKCYIFSKHKRMYKYFTWNSLKVKLAKVLI